MRKAEAGRLLTLDDEGTTPEWPHLSIWLAIDKDFIA